LLIIAVLLVIGLLLVDEANDLIVELYLLSFLLLPFFAFLSMFAVFVQPRLNLYLVLLNDPF